MNRLKNRLKTQIRRVLRQGKPKDMDSFEWSKYKKWAKIQLNEKESKNGN